MPSLADNPIVPGLRPLSVSAPFGNYIRPAGCTATLGTFTVHDRPGRPWRILKTVRYYPRLKAWVNRIGLRNPGLGYVEKKVARGKLDLADKVVSVHGFDAGEWTNLLERIRKLRPMAVELNMSCPNVGQIDWPETLFADAVAAGVPTIVKLPPVNYEQMADSAYEAGVRAFHCCNTLPVPGGGLSGAPLKPVALRCVRDLRARPWGDDVLIVGGGGVYAADDLDDYRDAGVDAFAVGTLTMNPVLLFSHRRVVPIRERAEALCEMEAG
ncbi:MAG: hypothetical protein AAF800_07485 [Planctomycetota bacterium]